MTVDVNTPSLATPGGISDPGLIKYVSKSSLLPFHPFRAWLVSCLSHISGIVVETVR